MASHSQLGKMESSGNPPSYEETTQVSNSMITKFISQLETARSCKNLLHVLLSDNGLSPDDKCKAMEKTDEIPALEQEKETMCLEDRLRLQDSHKLAQSVCYCYNIRYASKYKGWCKALIQADIEIRWIVQRIIWVHQQIQDGGTQAFDLYLERLNPKYWRVHRKLWIAIDRIASKSAARAFASQRMHIDWYLSAELREDCERRGGCCGRTCGCCERPRTIDGLNTEGMHNRGHCTSACSCCLNAHGLNGNYIGDEITDLQDLRFETTITRWADPHTLRLLKGYVFYLK